MRLDLPIALTLLALLSSPTAAQTQTDFFEQLDHDQPLKRQVAYASFEEKDGPAHRYRSAALTHVAKLHKRDAGRREALVAKLLRGLPLDGARRRRPLQRKVDAWLQARGAALLAVLDEAAYPHPGRNHVVTGPFKGASKVNAAMKRARKAIAPLASIVTEARETHGDAGLTLRLAELDALDALIAERASVLERNDRRPRARPPAPVELRLARALALLWSGKIEDANKVYEAQLAQLPIERLLYFVAYGESIIAANRCVELPDTCTAECRQAMAEMSRMRMACGVLPMEADATLTTAVTGHLRAMQRGRFFSHYTNDPKTRTPQIRCKAAGWKGNASENLASPGPMDSITVWMWDGGHARNILHPKWTWIGFATLFAGNHRASTFTGMNIGYGVPNRRPRPEFYGIPKE